MRDWSLLLLHRLYVQVSTAVATLDCALRNYTLAERACPIWIWCCYCQEEQGKRADEDG